MAQWPEFDPWNFPKNVLLFFLGQNFPERKERKAMSSHVILEYLIW